MQNSHGNPRILRLRWFSEAAVLKPRRWWHVQYLTTAMARKYTGKFRKQVIFCTQESFPVVYGWDDWFWIWIWSSSSWIGRLWLDGVDQTAQYQDPVAWCSMLKTVMSQKDSGDLESGGGIAIVCCTQGYLIHYTRYNLVSDDPSSRHNPSISSYLIDKYRHEAVKIIGWIAGNALELLREEITSKWH